MRLLIPAARPNPSGLARFGRLLHWCALALAAVFLLLAYMQWAQPDVQPTLAHHYPNRGLPPGFLLILAALTALIGRASRYLFSNE